MTRANPAAIAGNPPPDPRDGARDLDMKLE